MTAPGHSESPNALLSGSRAERALAFLEAHAPRSSLLRYACAPAAALLAALVQYVLLPEPSIAPYVFFYLSVALVAWLVGGGPGFITVLLSAVIANWAFVPPYRHLNLGGPALTATLMFLVSAGAVALLCALFRDVLLDARRAAVHSSRQAALLRESEKALRESEEHNRALVMATSDALYRMSPDWSEMRWLHGPGFLAETAEPTTHWLEKYIHPDDQLRVKAAIDEAIRTRTTFELEHRVLRPDGSLGWTFSRAVPLTDASGVILEWFGAATDVTERKHADEALRIANERLAEADRRKNEFLAVLSHELRNPLAPIRNSIYIAGRATPGSEQTKRALSVIERQVSQLTRLVDDLLDVTRIAHGKIGLRREKVDLQSLAIHTVDDYHDVFDKNGLHLEVSHADEPLFVIGDPARLAQIIGNLLQNAAKFTPRGSRTTVSIRADEHLAEVSVEDDGPGIAPDVLPTLFEPFMQGEKTLARSSGGLGLGLALVKGLVELHGGSIQAQTGKGGGATFVVRIPVEARTTPRLTVVAPPAATSTPRRVLVIEDNIDAAETLKEALELNGHAVALAYSGVEGVEKARAFRPDVVICDVGLPGMNGLEVARELRADPDLRTSTLIALSGYALPEDVDRAVAAGFDLHFAKPPDLAALEHSIH